MPDSQDKTICIHDRGREERLDFDDALAFHRGDARWGCAVAFRALQRAGQLLSKERPWDRQTLHIRSGHPGPGVRDTIEFVTHGIADNRFELTHPGLECKCTSDLEYEWEISDGKNMARVRLRDDFVPAEFFALLDRMEAKTDTHTDKIRLEQIKQALIEKIWREPLEHCFPDVSLEPVSTGEK